MASSSTSQGNGSGRKKMNMALIEKKSNLQVTFSKRRTGLFKKASELCTLTGTEMAIVVFSPGKKVFSFGHPSVNKIMNKCFPEGGERNDDVLMRYGGRIVEAHRETNLEQLHEDVKTAELELEVERKRSAAIDERVKTELQWLKPTEKMTESELDEMNSCLRALEDAVTRMRVSMGGEPNLTRPSFVSDMDNRGFEPVNDPNVGNMVMNPVGHSDMNNMGNMVHVPNMGGVNPVYVPVMNQMGELLPVPNMGYSGTYQMHVPNMGYSGMNQMGELLPVPNIDYSDMNQTSELIPLPNLGYTDMTYPLMNMENQSVNQMGRVEPIMDLANTGLNSDMENPYMNPFGVPVPMPDMGNPGMNPMDGQVQDIGDWDFNPMDRVDMGSNLFH